MAVTTPVLVKRFLDLTDKRKTHEDAADTIKTELAALQDELIVRFQNSGVRSMAFNGCRTIYIHRQLWAGSAIDDKAQFARAVKDVPDLAAFVKASVNSQQFSAWVRERAQEWQGEMPLSPSELTDKIHDQYPSIAGLVKVTEKFSVRAIKS